MPQQYFVNIELNIPEESYDLAYMILGEFPIQGIEERIDQLYISFKKEDWDSQDYASGIIAGLNDYDVPASLGKVETIEQQNWNEQWEQSLEPVVVSERITITPEWHKDKVQAQIPLVINPKMSFGTGYHPTTRMTTRFVEKYTKPKSTWIDVGTGTGVLAIAAVKLGAVSVYAFDNDPWSIENSIENVELNGVSNAIKVEQADIFTVELPQSDGIAANLYRNILIPNFPKLHSVLKSADSPLIISGVLVYDTEEIIAEAKKSGFQYVEIEQEDEWVAIVFMKGT
jgi:ribosomal protein L11 methyltransferase